MLQAADARAVAVAGCATAPAEEQFVAPAATRALDALDAPIESGAGVADAAAGVAAD